MRVINEKGFTEPSLIQEKAIPLIFENKDVIGVSSTGSGKTLAFAAGIIQRCTPKQYAQALILTPTRELAEQVTKVIKEFTKYTHLKTAVIYGGVAINPQIQKLKKADIVVGTPGRILDHLSRGTIDFGDVKNLVLDEADMMLDMGFIHDVEKIIRECPKERQTMLFSATMPNEILHLTKRHMVNPIRIDATPQVDPSKLSQVYYDVRDNEKFSLLVSLMKKEKEGLVMVFCNSRSNVDFVAENLKQNGIEAMAIHGGFSQDKRSRVMDKFHSKNVYVLVCTDVAGRGLDISGVSHVYNYDIPRDSKQYVHRIGRTARAGEKGQAINILASRDHDNFTRVLRDNDLRIDKEETPHLERVKIRRVESRNDHGFGGGRNNMGRGGHRGPSRGRSNDRGDMNRGNNKIKQHNRTGFKGSRKNNMREARVRE
ncbi:DEAD/DEAH box helicase [Candidatus Woesearchaeota archaeon]|nr:DEAD/DEAH box helicase [Candidatus Woesearchaeota archaeon]